MYISITGGFRCKYSFPSCLSCISVRSFRTILLYDQSIKTWDWMWQRTNEWNCITGLGKRFYHMILGQFLCIVNATNIYITFMLQYIFCLFTEKEFQANTWRSLWSFKTKTCRLYKDVHWIWVDTLRNAYGRY